MTVRIGPPVCGMRGFAPPWVGCMMHPCPYARMHPTPPGKTPTPWVADAPWTDQPKGAGVCLFYIKENLGFRKAPLLAEHYGPRKRTAR
jgi:hypothetical protein